MRGGKGAVTLPAGYLGSSLIGALLTFCGFNIVASKIASFVVGAAFLLIIWWGRRDWLTIGTVLAAIGLLVGCWFIAEAEALRYVIVSSPGCCIGCQLSSSLVSPCGASAADLSTCAAFYRCHVFAVQRLGYLRRSDLPEGQ